jgi:ankyrin repeat protein
MVPQTDVVDAHMHAGINERHHVTGRTPLHEAVMLNNMTTVRLLLDAGADANAGHTSQVRLCHAAGSQPGLSCSLQVGCSDVLQRQCCLQGPSEQASVTAGSASFIPLFLKLYRQAAPG